MSRPSSSPLRCCYYCKMLGELNPSFDSRRGGCMFTCACLMNEHDNAYEYICPMHVNLMRGVHALHITAKGEFRVFLFDDYKLHENEINAKTWLKPMNRA